MKLSRTSRFLLDTGTRSLLKLITGIGNILVTWWLVRQLGETGFGIYRAAMASASLFALAGGGMSAAAYGLIVQAIAQNRLEHARMLVAASVRFLASIGLMVVALAWPAGFGLAWLYGISEQEFTSFSTTASIAVCSLAMGFFSMPFVWVVQARQREFILNLAHLPLSLVTPALIIVSVMITAEPWAPALATLGMVIMGNGMCIVISLYLHPWLRPLKTGGGQGKVIMRRSVYAVLEQVAGVVIGQALVWSVTVIAGPAGLGVIVASMTFFAFTRDMLSTVSATLVAPIGTLFHQGNSERAIQAWKDALSVNLLIAGTVAGVLAIHNHKVITLWLGPTMNADEPTVLLMAAYLVLGSLVHPSQAALYAVDGYRERAFLLGAEAALSVPMAIALGYWFGSAGCLFALVVVQGILFVAYPWCLRRRCGGIAWGYFAPLLRLMTALAVTTFLLAAFSGGSTHTTWVSLLVEVGLCGTVLCLIGWIFGLANSTKQRLKQRVLSIWIAQATFYESSNRQKLS